MNSVRVNSYAKLNLSLNITGVKDGYHLLDSFVATVDIFDRIVLKKRKDSLINVTMHGQGTEYLFPENNVAVKAGEAFVKCYQTDGADITVYKNIPVGAGMGGSSADAAGVLNGMAKLYGVKDEGGIKALADGLASDTGYMLKGGIARMKGRGEAVESLKNGVKLWFLLLVPPSSVSTAACYAAYDALPPEGERQDTERCISAFLNGDVADMGASFYNSLQQAAVKLNGDVEKALKEAANFSPLGYGM
ncbi:MAG: hypothetical protein J6Z36_04780, partial [Clostridia bacterium]|nr:hypothetical protein [Clostridia bacterium]